MKEMCLKIKGKLAIFVSDTKRDICVAIFKLGRLLSYCYHSSTWQTKLFFRKIGRLYIEHAIVIRPAIFLVIFGILGYLIAVRLEFSQLATDKLADFLFAGGAMLGGVIAVVFSFSLFSVQNAADLYSSQFFETYSRDNKEKIVFFAITLITVLFFVTGIAISWEYAFLLAHPRGVAFTSLMLIGVTFVLVDYQFEIVRRKVDPARAINFLEKKALYFLNVINQDVQKMATIISLQSTEVSKKTATAVVYKQVADIHLVNLDRQIENLFEISMKLSSRDEVYSTNMGLRAVHNAVNKYMDNRKNDSIALPSSITIFATESDSQAFLSRIYERFNATCDFFIRTKKTPNAQFIISIYRSLGIKAAHIDFSEQRSGNPIFEQVRGYLNQCIRIGFSEKNHDIVFDGVRAYENLASIAVQKGLRESVYSIQTDLPDFIPYALKNNQLYIADACLMVHIKIIGTTLVCKTPMPAHIIEESLERMFNAIYLLSRVSDGSFTSHQTVSNPFDSLVRILSSVVDAHNTTQLAHEKKFYKETLFILLASLYSEIRRFSEQFKNAGLIPVNKVSNLIQYIIDLLIALLKDKEFSSENTELKKHLNSYIHLCGFVVDNSDAFEASSYSFHELFEVPAKTGIDLFKGSADEDLMEDCVQTVYWIVKNAMKKDPNLSESSSINLLMNLVYLGVLALKFHKDQLFEDIVLSIYEFEYVYFDKYIKNLSLPSFINPNTTLGIPKKDDLCRSAYMWLSDFGYSKYNHHGLMDTAEDRMYLMVDAVDIEWFIFEVWGSFTSGSPIEKLIKERYAKSHKVSKLLQILKIRKVKIERE